jgi:hypothetical protein
MSHNDYFKVVVIRESPCRPCLITLAPAPAEMDFAFRWVVSQDPSPGFRIQLEGLADYLGVRDVLDAVEG